MPACMYFCCNLFQQQSNCFNCCDLVLLLKRGKHCDICSFSFFVFKKYILSLCETESWFFNQWILYYLSSVCMDMLAYIFISYTIHRYIKYSKRIWNFCYLKVYDLSCALHTDLAFTCFILYKIHEEQHISGIKLLQLVIYI